MKRIMLAQADLNLSEYSTWSNCYSPSQQTNPTNGTKQTNQQTNQQFNQRNNEPTN